MTVRAFFQVAKIANFQPPFDTIFLKVFYPAIEISSEEEKTNLTVPANSLNAPFPVVILFNGYNCEAFVYQWLAEKLTERGLVVVTFNFVAEEFPGNINLTPGANFTASKPDVYGTKPTSVTLPTLLLKLEELQTQGVLAGLLDLERITLGGHSAGGKFAIENANPKFFSQVAASFGYGVHSMGYVMQGYPPGTILPLPDQLPLLLLAGTNDGVITNSSAMHGIEEGDAITPTMRTWKEAILGGRQDSYVVFIEGANHFVMAHPLDPTAARNYLDFPLTQPAESIRSFMAEAIGLFIGAHVQKQPDALESLQNLLNSNSLVNSWHCK
ncbi:MAG: dienelactone hydrolase [Calothrix sp. C42_A2020_038]|nr:dienelactone hydrolase [Calothrix sp. C42_A2020_038]